MDIEYNDVLGKWYVKDLGFFRTKEEAEDVMRMMKQDEEKHDIFKGFMFKRSQLDQLKFLAEKYGKKESRVVRMLIEQAYIKEKNNGERKETVSA